MSAAPVCAFAAAVCGVGAAWEAAAAVEQAAVAKALARLLSPLRSGRPAAEPDAVALQRRLTLVTVAATLAAGWLLAGAPAGLVLATAAPLALQAGVRARSRRWQAALDAGASAAARALADALTAGRSIRGAITEVGSSGGCGGAVDEELAACAAAIDLGAPTDAVLERLRTRAASPAWDTIVAAVLLQREAGGNLAGLLRAIAQDVEAARRAEADAHTATAQARFTARMVAALPCAAAVLAELADPGTLTGLASEPLPAMLLITAAALQVVALLSVRRLAR